LILLSKHYVVFDFEPVRRLGRDTASFISILDFLGFLLSSFGLAWDRRTDRQTDKQNAMLTPLYFKGLNRGSLRGRRVL